MLWWHPNIGKSYREYYQICIFILLMIITMGKFLMGMYPSDRATNTLDTDRTQPIWRKSNETNFSPPKLLVLWTQIYSAYWPDDEKISVLHINAHTHVNITINYARLWMMFPRMLLRRVLQQFKHSIFDKIYRLFSWLNPKDIQK